jgi:hypothetical protein
MAKRNHRSNSPRAQVARAICLLRGHRVLLDAHLAELYGVEVRVLLQAVKRNRKRFPDDFMFQLSTSEWSALRSRTVISKSGSGGRRYAPYAFTRQGVAMLSTVPGSERAIATIMSAIRQLTGPPATKRRGIGFSADVS